MSRLWFRYAAMNAGKSTALLQVAYNYEERNMRILLAKPSVDTKGGQKVVSRVGLARDVDLLIPPGLDVFSAVSGIVSDSGGEPLACILVDESQFLSRAQVDGFFKVAVKLKVPVICYGLRTDFTTKAFEGSSRLLEVAHSLEELKTICACGSKAIFNGRKVGGVFVKEGDTVAIDGDAVEYESVCGVCYLTKVSDF